MPPPAAKSGSLRRAAANPTDRFTGTVQFKPRTSGYPDRIAVCERVLFSEIGAGEVEGASDDLSLREKHEAASICIEVMRYRLVFEARYEAARILRDRDRCGGSFSSRRDEQPRIAALLDIEINLGV